MSNLNIQNTLMERIERIAHIGHWRYDVKKDELFWSDEVYRIHGLTFSTYTPEVVSALDAYHPDDQQDLENAVKDAIEHTIPFEIQKRVLRPDGEIRHVIVRGEAETCEKGKVLSIFGTLQDITQLILTQEKLENSNKDLDIFATTAAHDLKAPLRSISGFLEILKEKYGTDLDKEANEYIDFAVTGAHDLSSLIENILQYARLGTEKTNIENVDLDMLVKTTVRLRKATIKETGAQFEIGELPTIQCDEYKIKSLFGNLIENALKYKTDAAPKIKISAEKRGQHWLFCIEDNGIGIKTENLETIFVMFNRLHNKQEFSGTGIGLAVCDKIVKLHGGEIWAESQFGKGSAFYFTIPQKSY